MRFERGGVPCYELTGGSHGSTAVVQHTIAWARRNPLPSKAAVTAQGLAVHTLPIPAAGNPRLCFVGGMDYEVLCGEWGGNRASRLGGGNRAANATHTGLKTGPAADGAAPAAAGCASVLRRGSWRAVLRRALRPVAVRSRSG